MLLDDDVKWIIKNTTILCPLTTMTVVDSMMEMISFSFFRAEERRPLNTMWHLIVLELIFKGFELLVQQDLQRLTAAEQDHWNLAILVVKITLIFMLWAVVRLRVGELPVQ